MTSLILIFAMLGKHSTIAALNALNAKTGPTRATEKDEIIHSLAWQRIAFAAMAGKHGTIAALNTLNAKNGPTRVFALTVISDGAGVYDDSKPLSRGVVGKTPMVEELGRWKVNAAYSGVLRRLALCLLLRWASSHTISTQEVARGFLRRLTQRFDLLYQGRSAREHPSLDSISMIVL
ncbi:hypothetical protein Tco_0769422 [Tanacetum coccineum]|uniref:Uncharacterized protein n=1 Tax=Tanacetum coccineum TaxID=301880 RepID=A0ABQ4ZB54_9ASTR